MANISEQIYALRLQQSPESVKLFISKIYSDENFSSFIQKYRSSASDKEDLADNVRSEVLRYVLKVSTAQQLIDNVVETLDIKPDEAENVIADLFSICIPEEIQNYAEGNNPSKDTVREEKHLDFKNSDANAISHKDLLSEIENPTPSISTTASFQISANKAAATDAVKTASTPDAFKTAPGNATVRSAEPAESSLHSSATIPAYANPALKIASKLEQNMATPSASIPKDIYVSKKPDPYHEPVDL